MLLVKSIRNLTISSGATQVRLWGKIRGTERDYYILEGTVEAKEGGEEEPAEGVPKIEGFEARGNEDGLNKSVYWASNSPLQVWTMLPDVRPSDI